MANAVFILSWTKLLGSFESSLGNVIPQQTRKQLLAYFTKGEIPKGFLYGLLTKNFQTTFASPKSNLEAQRLQTIWEFLQNCVPLNQWGSVLIVDSYARAVQEGEVDTMQTRYYERKKAAENNIFDREDIIQTS
jgi:hypothetical protein